MCICFPGETTVTTKRGVKRLDDLQPGDEILTLSRRTGISKWTKFYTWGHREPNATAEFLVLALNNGKQLKISTEHLIFVDGEKGRKIAKMAGQLCEGDKLFHLNEAGFMEISSIVGITAEMITGVYAPFTMSGHFLADGILVANYGAIESFDKAHGFLAPLRAMYRLRESLSKGDANQDGIHGYCGNLMKIRDILPTPLRNWVN